MQKNEALISKAHQDYLNVAQGYLDKARQTLALIEQQGLADILDLVKKSEIEGFMVHVVLSIPVQRDR